RRRRKPLAHPSTASRSPRPRSRVGLAGPSFGNRSVVPSQHLLRVQSHDHLLDPVSLHHDLHRLLGEETLSDLATDGQEQFTFGFDQLEIGSVQVVLAKSLFQIPKWGRAGETLDLD